MDGNVLTFNVQTFKGFLGHSLAVVSHGTR